MPTNYNFTENGLVYSFDDIFVPAEIFYDKNLFTWGNGLSGRLGDRTADFASKSTPITTFSGGTNWRQVDAGSGHIIAIKTDGTLWGWGLNNLGQIGSANLSNTLTPVTTFAAGTNWKQVSAGDLRTQAIKTDGTLWTWGYGKYGALGNADTTNRSTPVTTFAGGTNWKQVSGGYFHTVAVKTDGTLWTWGNGGSGRLGNADTTNRSTPVTTFSGGTDWKQVSAGSDFTSAITYDGSVL